MDSLVNQWIIVQAYKHNGELHRQWSHGFVLEENEDFIVVASIRASVIENDGRKWHTKEPAMFILFKKEWFNVIAMYKDDGISYYTNIASPTIFDKGYLKYIDYDLDIKLYGDGSTRLLDVNEYNKHAEEQKYSEDIKLILKKTVEKIYDKIKNRDFPFVNDKIYEYYEEFLRRTHQK